MGGQDFDNTPPAKYPNYKSLNILAQSRGEGVSGSENSGDAQQQVQQSEQEREHARDEAAAGSYADAFNWVQQNAASMDAVGIQEVVRKFLVGDGNYSPAGDMTDQIELGGVMAERPDLGEAVLQQARISAVDGRPGVRRGVQEVLRMLLLSRPDMAGDVLTMAKAAAEDPKIRDAAMETFGCIGTARPDMADDVIGLLETGAEDSNQRVRIAAVKAAGEITWNQPNMAERVYGLLTKTASADGSDDVRGTALEAIKNMGVFGAMRGRPDLERAAFNLAKASTVKDKGEFTRMEAWDVLGWLAYDRPDLATDTILNLSKAAAKDPNWDIRDKVQNALGQAAVTSKRSDVAQAALDLANENLSDPDKSVRLGAKDVYDSLNIAFPDLKPTPASQSAEFSKSNTRSSYNSAVAP